MADLSQFVSLKAQTSPEKIIDSSMRTFGSMQRNGINPLFNYKIAVGQCRGWVYAATRMNAQAVASTPLRMYVRKRGGERLVNQLRKVPHGRKRFLCGAAKRMPSNYVMTKTAAWDNEFEEVTEQTPLLKLLSRPNPWMNGFEFAQMRMLFLQLTGNFYMHPVVESAKVGKQGVNRVNELWVAPSQYVKIVPAERHTGEWVKEYIYGVDTNAERRFSPDEILHFKLPNPGNQWYGLGVVEAGFTALRILASQAETDQAKYDNHARPDLAVITKSMNGTQEQLNELQNRWAATFRGTFRQGAPVFLTGDTNVIPLNWMPTEIGAREITIEEIAAVTGVPVTLIKANDPNLASSQVGFASWREMTTLPYCRMDEEYLNTSLLPIYGIEDDAFLAYDDPVPENRDEMRNDIVQFVGKVWTPNEGRAKLGDEPLDDENADKLLVPSGLVPLDMVGKAPAMSPMQFTLGGGNAERMERIPTPERNSKELEGTPAKLIPRTNHDGDGRITKQSISIYANHKGSANDGTGDADDTAREGEKEKPIREMRDALAKVFNEQRREIQNMLTGRKAFVEGYNDILAALRGYAPDIADAIAPFMELQLVAGGAAGLESIELPADAFSVINPMVRAFVDTYTVRLAGEINNYTAERLSETLGEGLEAGDSATGLSARVGELYDDFDGYRTEMIARTESARAYSAGSESAWKQSGVVEGKKWLLASAACPICSAIARHFAGKVVPLDHPFYALGESIPLADGKSFLVDYAPIMGPPGHPHCRCGVTAVLMEGKE